MKGDWIWYVVGINAALDLIIRLALGSPANEAVIWTLFNAGLVFLVLSAARWVWRKLLGVFRRGKETTME